MANKKYRFHSNNISRRDFLKLAAAAGLLAGCNAVERPTVAPGLGEVKEEIQSPPAPPSSTPLSTDPPLPTTPTSIPTNTPPPPDIPTPTETPLADPPAPTKTPLPANTPIPTDTPAPPATPTMSATLSRADLIKIYPHAPSKVAWTHHAGVWPGDTLSPEAIRQMLDASITALTGLADATAAWAALFDPDERIAIKVNTISGSDYWTHVPLVMAVAERLQTIGIPPEQLIIFDRSSSELERAGFTVNPDGPGVRCFGTDERYTAAGWTISGEPVSLSSILLDCDALINMPILKQHGITGISFAMKNHYGTFDKPGHFHGERAVPGLPGLNALPPIRERTRLIIGDVLAVVKSGWRSAVPGDSIFMSFDPVAHDALGLQVYSQVMAAAGLNPGMALDLANPWLKYGTELGLGTHNPDHMDVVEVILA